MDWKDLRYKGELHAYMIPPTRLDDSYGELTGVDWSSLNITAAYYSDTRVSGQLSFSDDSWIPGSFIRIVFEIPDEDYTRTLGTFAAMAAPATYKNGKWTTTLTLHSMLYTMSLDNAPTRRTIAKNALYLDAMAAELKDAGRAYIMKDALQNRASATTVMESGKSRLSRMFAYCENSKNRLDVDADGKITIEPYKRPAEKSPSMEIDLDDPRGVAMDGVTRNTDYLSMPTKAAVIYRYTETVDGESVQKEIAATATVSATSHAHQSARGYTITDVHELSEMQPATAARAQQLAKEYLASDEVEHIEWTLNTKYLPLWEGDVIDLVIPNGMPEYRGTRKCLVKTLTLKGRYLDMQLVLKETASGDDE